MEEIGKLREYGKGDGIGRKIKRWKEEGEEDEEVEN